MQTKCIDYTILLSLNCSHYNTKHFYWALQIQTTQIRFFFFFKFGNLKAHLKIHIADGPLKCKECGKQFTTSGEIYTLRQGVAIYIYVREGILMCLHGLFTGNLKRHLRVHSGEKPFICMHCQRAFADPGALQRHVRIHTGLSRFSRPQPLLPLKIYLTVSVLLF